MQPPVLGVPGIYLLQIALCTDLEEENVDGSQMSGSMVIV